jgi:hypothetical protein
MKGLQMKHDLAAEEDVAVATLELDRGASGCTCKADRAQNPLDVGLGLLRQASDIAHANPDYDAETRSLMRERIGELELPA